MGYVDRGAAERLGAELVDIVLERERDDRDFTRALALEVGASALRLLLPTMTSADREHFERDALATPHQVPEGTINSESRHFPVLLQALRLHAIVIEQVYENAMRSAGVSIDSGMRSRLLDALFPQAAPSHDKVGKPFEGSAQSAASATDASPGSLSNEGAVAGTTGGSPDASSQGEHSSPGSEEVTMEDTLDVDILDRVLKGEPDAGELRPLLIRILGGDAEAIAPEQTHRDADSGLQLPPDLSRSGRLARLALRYHEEHRRSPLKTQS